MQKKLTDEEKDVVKNHVPWTRLVEDAETEYDGKKVSLMAFLRENKDRMVLKPIGLYGGKNVAIGHEMPAGDWEDVLKTALEERYVAQEYIPIPEIDLPVFSENGLEFVPKKVNMNFFAFNGKYAGGMGASIGQFHHQYFRRRWIDPHSCRRTSINSLITIKFKGSHCGAFSFSICCRM